MNPLIEAAGPQQQQLPPCEWLMVGFSCAVTDVDINGHRMKALVFARGDNPEGLRFVFPMDSSGARNIGNQLLDKPAIYTPELQLPKI